MKQQLINFLSTIEQVKSTLRHNWTRTGRQESVAEHTWMAAVFLVLAFDLFKIEIDLQKAVKMMLIHDIPELVAGDVPGFEKTENDRTAEHKNAKKVFDELPAKIKDQYWALYLELEAKETLEARLVNAIEKVESQLQHLNSGPEYWSNEERGGHMLHYPDQALALLADERVDDLWEMIKVEIGELT